MAQIREGRFQTATLQHNLAAMEPDSLTPPRRSLATILFVIFLRMVALSCLVFGVQYWGMLSGYLLEGRARFDLLNLPWKVAGAGLSVLFPVAALGLWLTVSWGPVVWVIAAGAQVAMYTVWPDIFGANLPVVIMHGVVVVLFTLFRVQSAMSRGHAALSVRVDSP